MDNMYVSHLIEEMRRMKKKKQETRQHKKMPSNSKSSRHMDVDNTIIITQNRHPTTSGSKKQTKKNRTSYIVHFLHFLRGQSQTHQSIQLFQAE